MFKHLQQIVAENSVGLTVPDTDTVANVLAVEYNENDPGYIKSLPFEVSRVPKLLNEMAFMYASMVGVDPDFGLLAGRLLTKKITYNICGTFTQHFEKYCHHTPKMNLVVTYNSHKLDKMIDTSRDHLMDFSAMKAAIDIYLLKDPETGEVVESVQYMYMRVAIGMVINGDVSTIRDLYKGLQGGYFTVGTPILCNASLAGQNLISCYVTDFGNGTNDEIADAVSKLLKFSAKGGGVSVSATRYPAISKTNKRGWEDVAKMLDTNCNFVSKHGERSSATAMYVEIWHADIQEFIELKRLKTGATHIKKKVNLAIWTPSLFMQRVKNNGKWSLFDPTQCGALNLLYGGEFDEMYIRLEEEGKAKYTIMARDLLSLICENEIETGMPYLMFKDHVNNKSNHKHRGVIKGSNLCGEIMLYHDSSETAICVLGSLCLPQFVVDGNFDFALLGKMTKILLMGLNGVLDVLERSNNTLPDVKKGILNQRPVGIGTQGFADMLCLMKKDYDSTLALELNEKIYEHIYYNAIEGSIRESQEDDPLPYFYADSPMSKGIFQFDMWGQEPKLAVLLPKSCNLDWDKLKKKVLESPLGLKNTMLTAQMPTSSTSRLTGCSESTDPNVSNYYTKIASGGSFVMFNKHLVRELKELKLWTPQVATEIRLNNGSVQAIETIPRDVKLRYRTAFELKQNILLNMAADRGKYICQSQSTNLFWKVPSIEKIVKAHYYAFSLGLKTSIYYTRVLASTTATKITASSSHDDMECDTHCQ